MMFVELLTPDDVAQLWAAAAADVVRDDCDRRDVIVNVTIVSVTVVRCWLENAESVDAAMMFDDGDAVDWIVSPIG